MVEIGDIHFKLEGDWNKFERMLKNMANFESLLESFMKAFGEKLNQKIREDISGQKRAWAGFISDWEKRKTAHKGDKLIHLGNYLASFGFKVEKQGDGFVLSWGTDSVQSLYLEFGGGSYNRNPSRAHVEPIYTESIDSFIEKLSDLVLKELSYG